MGDFNDDGYPDLAVTNFNANTVSVLIGYGEGRFAPTKYLVGSHPEAVAVADFNHDGEPDLVVANTSDNTVTLLLGDGSGSFAQSQILSVGTSPFSVAAGDFNGDESTDLAVPNFGDNTVSILLNQCVTTPAPTATATPSPDDTPTATRTVTQVFPVYDITCDYNRSCFRVPPLWVPQGTSVEFDLAASTVGGTPTFTIAPSPLPRGVTLSNGNHFSYQNNSEDYAPFIISICASSGSTSACQDVTISPAPVLPPEAKILSIVAGSTTPTPTSDEETSLEYLVTTCMMPDTKPGAAMIDCADATITPTTTPSATPRSCGPPPTHNRVRSVTITGKTLVFSRDDRSGLYEAYRYAPDIKELTISAEKVVIKQPLILPEAKVTIYARELRFEDEDPEPQNYARIDTTPEAPIFPACGFEWHGQAQCPSMNGALVLLEPPSKPAEPGTRGRNGGSISVFLADGGFLPPSEASGPQFIMRGGTGQDGGKGEDGLQGCSVGVLQASQCGPQGNRYPGYTVSMNVNDCGPCGLGDTCCECDPCGVPLFPGNGGDAKSGGMPGPGGDAGNFQFASDVDLSRLADVNAGRPGRGAGDYIGGPAGTPNPAWKFQDIPCGDTIVLGPAGWLRHDQSPGNSASSLSGSAGQGGLIARVSNSRHWLTPATMRVVLAHVRDVYINQQFDTARDILRTYHGILKDFQLSSHWSSISTTDQREFQRDADEIATLLNQLAMNRDFFGNPPGWVPMLALQVAEDLYETEVDRSLEALHLARWYRTAANETAYRGRALDALQRQFIEELGELRDQYTTVSDAISSLQTLAQTIAAQISAIQAALQAREQTLLAAATEELKRQKGAGWKQVVSTLGSILKVLPIPAAQPTLFAIGSGLQTVATFDPAKPFGAQVVDLANTFKDFNNKIGNAKANADNWQTTFDRIDLTYLDGKLCSGAATRTTCQSDSECKIKTGPCLTSVNYCDKDHSIVCGDNADCPEKDNGECKTGYDNLSASAQPFVQLGEQLGKTFEQTAVADNDVKALLDRLKASDPEFQDLIDEVRTLTLRKAEFADRLAQALSAATIIFSRVQNNMLALDAVAQTLGQDVGVLNPRVQQYVDDMEQRAKERLRRYHYYLVKAFEHRTLQPVPRDWLNLQLTIEQIERQLDNYLINHRNPSVRIIDDDSELRALKAPYLQLLSDINQNVLSSYQAGRSSAPVPIDLTTDEVDQLNTPASPLARTSFTEVRINLRDRLTSEGRPPLDLSNKDNITVEDIEVSDVQFVPSTVPSSGLAEFTIQHAGVGFLTSGEDTFQFRYHNDTQRAQNPLLTWRTDYEFPNGPLTQEPPVSSSDLWLFRTIVGSQTTADPRAVYAQPAAWADLYLSKNTDARVKSLQLKVQYRYQDTDADRAVVDIRVFPESLFPYIHMQPRDLDLRTDGRGGLRRVYDRGTEVSFAVPKTLGETWRFAGWSTTPENILDHPNDPDFSEVGLSATNANLVANYSATTPGPSPTSGPSTSCVGDCNGNGAVTIDELLTGVNLALGNATAEQCAAFDCNGDGRVTVDCLVGAVSDALRGCTRTRGRAALMITPTSYTQAAALPVSRGSTRVPTAPQPTTRTQSATHSPVPTGTTAVPTTTPSRTPDADG